jgi:uncharacterized protein (TIGR04255 family)
LLVQKPVHRFRQSQNGYPLVQIGPGIITLNTLDALYDWDKDFAKRCNQITSTFFKIYQAAENDKFQPTLIYIDFLQLDEENESVIEYINRRLSLKISPSFEPDCQPTRFNLGLEYKTNGGDIIFTLNLGNHNDKIGLLMQSNLRGEEFASKDNVVKWLEDAHTQSTKLFKEVTKGKLYDSFK